jgi:uncharacterized protein YbgA (DUF1722 family)
MKSINSCFESMYINYIKIKLYQFIKLQTYYDFKTDQLEHIKKYYSSCLSSSKKKYIKILVDLYKKNKEEFNSEEFEKIFNEDLNDFFQTIPKFIEKNTSENCNYYIELYEKLIKEENIKISFSVEEYRNKLLNSIKKFKSVQMDFMHLYLD